MFVCMYACMYVCMFVNIMHGWMDGWTDGWMRNETVLNDDCLHERNLIFQDSIIIYPVSKDIVIE